MDKIENKFDISVIIPAYNIYPYIKHCLDSVLTQTYPSFEVIVVDDGSSDGTSGIVDEYASKDKRIRVIHQTNSGLPSARNSGLSEASGRYILHVDGDDWIEQGCFSSMFKCAEEYDADVVFCNHVRDDGIGHTWHIKNTLWQTNKIYEGKDLLLDMALTRTSHSSWNKLIKRNLYVDNCILYPPKIVMAEDMATTFRLAMVARKVVKCQGAFYHYRVRPGSLMETHNYKGRDGYAPIEVLREFASNLPDSKKWLELVDFHFYYRQFRWIVKNTDRTNDKKDGFAVYSDFIANAQDLVKNSCFAKIPFLYRMFIRSYAFSPSIGVIVNNIWFFAVFSLKRRLSNLKKKLHSVN